MVAFLYGQFLFFILFFLSFIHTFLLLSFLVFLIHTRIPTLISILYSYFPFLLNSTTHSPALFFYFIFFYLIQGHSLALCVIRLTKSCLPFGLIIFKHTQTCMERKEKLPLLHHTATAASPPHCGVHATRGHIGFYFFLLVLD